MLKHNEETNFRGKIKMIIMIQREKENEVSCREFTSTTDYKRCRAKMVCNT